MSSRSGSAIQRSRTIGTASAISVQWEGTGLRTRKVSAEEIHSATPGTRSARLPIRAKAIQENAAQTSRAGNR